MIRYFRWSPLARTLVPGLCSEQQIREVALLNSKLLCLLSVQWTSSNQSNAANREHFGYLFNQLLKRIKIEPWNWYDLARASAYLNILPLHEPPASGYVIGGVLARNYIHSITSKGSAYSAYINQLLQEGCWDDIDAYILLDQNCSKHDLEQAQKEMSRDSNLPQLLQQRLKQVTAEIEASAKIQKFFQVDAQKKPSTKPIEVRNNKTLRMLVQLLQELCECQPTILNDEDAFKPIGKRMAAAVASATALNILPNLFETFHYNTLFELYCWLINIKTVLDVTTKMYPKTALTNTQQVELLKTIGKLGSLLSSKEPQWHIAQLAPVLARFEYTSSTAVIQSQLGKVAKHFRQAIKQSEEAWSHAEWISIYADHPDTKLSHIFEALERLSLSQCLMLYRRVQTESADPLFHQRITDRIAVLAAQSELSLRDFFVYSKELLVLNPSKTVQFRCRDLLDLAEAVAVALARRKRPKPVSSFHQRTIQSVVPLFQFQ